MSLEYKTRSRQYVDVSNASNDDRIKVTLDSGKVITLMPATVGAFRALEVDRKLTDKVLLDEIYAYIIERERNGRSWDGPFEFFYRWRYNRTIPSLEIVRNTAELEVSVRSDGDAFDNSPRIGERFCVMATLPKRGGSGWYTPSNVSKVEFYTL